MYEALTNRSRFSKQMILVCIDILILLLALYGAFALRFGMLYPHPILQELWILFPIMAVLGLGLLRGLGLSRIKLDTFERNAILRTGAFSFGLMIICSTTSYLLGYGAPRTVPIIFGTLFFAANISSRIAGQYLLDCLPKGKTSVRRVLVYGAGRTGIQLVSALRQTPELHPIAFIDDNSDVIGMIAAGLPVLDSRDVKKIIAAKNIDQVILAMPSINECRRNKIYNQLDLLGCEVQTLPSFLDIIDGIQSVKRLRPVSMDDLLSRDKIDIRLPEIERTYNGKTVMVTGAGGSIGSELCRQLIKCGIRKLVLYDHSELALYAIDRELQPVANTVGVDLVSTLDSVTDKGRVEAAFDANDIQIVLHAAAYKHVPLVEKNELAGLYNNVIGTKNVADAARKFGLERFILISTDKAVRPTNIMGSSKRIAELVVQDMASRSKETLFSMVRFGNVLGSSGSVIPLFHDQIAKGGPVTVTDENVTRYFMTLNEASRLVLLAGSFASGGDVFVLDMGEPVKIYDLARTMIELSGRTVCDTDNPNGDIAVELTGLRPGEKLYEELLIDADMLATPHKKILRARETTLSEIEVANAIRDLKTAFDTNDVISARTVIERWVDGYHVPQVRCV
jgi:FlaA1/EpsC-like NDP-sugar epimerase